ncbi:MAG: tRNA preQ1(34) S-adenosylmethionine ribosyltransferase-isomerase QueA [Alphaproteobacteria bacterium]|nr:tRNA preQ1(34) S-adenosylmethionine ribosyltransferase-isomerase QueA [Alphaproteobacteria bacterium]
MNLSDFDFELPESNIAQNPATPRDSARLLYISEAGMTDRQVYDLLDYCRSGDVWVFNNSKVIPARLYGQRAACPDKSRGEVKIEILLHKRMNGNCWEAFARPMKRLHIGDEIMFAENFTARVKLIKENGLAELEFAGSSEHMMASIMQHGLTPLPPYIKRHQKEAVDETRYQTVYAQHNGSVAAPTAGLHFTNELLQKMQEHGITIAYVILHVGAGTFQPVKTENIAEHVMHSEWVELSAAAAQAINTAKQNGGRVIAVGTTSTRVLESIADDNGQVKAWQGDTSIFITPGYRFKIVDVLMTNFHLPKSTLFMLVCAFAGMERMKAAYRHAIENNYRFYSYGDACFIEKAKN